MKDAVTKDHVLALEAEIGDLLERIEILQKPKKGLLAIDDRIWQDSKRAGADNIEFTNYLQDLDDEFKIFIQSVTHELRALLGRIDGFSHALFEDYAHVLDDEGFDFLRRVRKSCKAMADRLDELHTLSAMAQAPLHVQKVDLSRLASRIAAELQDAEAHRSIEFKIQPQLTANGDASLLYIAVKNIFHNACKFTRNTQKALVEFGNDIDKAAFYVRDNGLGFDEKNEKKLFAPFQTLHKNPDLTGAGIGLTTVRRIIHRHRGRIWAQSQPNQGATFFFTLHV